MISGQLTLLRKDVPARIVGFVEDSSSQTTRNINRIRTLGFMPGRDIKLQGRRRGTSRVRVANDIPFAVDKVLTDRIIVKAQEGDFFSTYKEALKEESVIKDIKKVWNLILIRFKR